MPESNAFQHCTELGAAFRPYAQRFPYPKLSSSCLALYSSHHPISLCLFMIDMTCTLEVFDCLRSPPSYLILSFCFDRISLSYQCQVLLRMGGFLFLFCCATVRFWDTDEAHMFDLDDAPGASGTLHSTVRLNPRIAIWRSLSQQLVWSA